MDSVDRKLFSRITQPRHLLPLKTSTHCPYGLRKRQRYCQLPRVEYTQYKNNFTNRCLFNFRWFKYDCHDDMFTPRPRWIAFGWLIILTIWSSLFRFLACILSFLILCVFNCSRHSVRMSYLLTYCKTDAVDFVGKSMNNLKCVSRSVANIERLCCHLSAL